MAPGQAMALYIVVHHNGDPDRPYANEWEADNQRLLSIGTRPGFFRQYQARLNSGERIYIHRCGWGIYPPHNLLFRDSNRGE